MECKSVNSVNIPDGEYKAKAGGYHVVVEGFEKEIIFLPIGIRGMNIICDVDIKNGDAIIKI